MAATKKSFSCLEFQCQLGISGYDTECRLMHKIRVVMGRRDALYKLNDMIEMDEHYVGEWLPKRKWKSNLKVKEASVRLLWLF